MNWHLVEAFSLIVLIDLASQPVSLRKLSSTSFVNSDYPQRNPVQLTQEPLGRYNTALYLALYFADS